MWVQIKVTIFNTLFGVFLISGLWLKRNFFKLVFEKTFHYTDRGWDIFTWSFAIFFFLTAAANEYVRQVFHGYRVYEVFGYEMTGVNVWILFKIAIVLPLTGIYAWALSRMMQKYRLPDPAGE
jgi:intracellular septation protein